MLIAKRLAGLLGVAAALPAFAGHAVMACAVQDNIDPGNRFQLRVTNSMRGKEVVPAGAAVKVRVVPTGSPTVVKSTNVVRNFRLEKALRHGEFATLGPADNVASCTAEATW
jgi:hypothetical protein